jgi:hypothetical protein
MNESTRYFIQKFSQGEEMMLDPENLEYILRARLHFNTQDLETYPWDRSYRLAQRSIVEHTVMRPDTYLRPMTESLMNQNKIKAGKQDDKKHFKVNLPKTWSTPSILKR